MRITEREALRVAKLITRRWASRKIVAVWRGTEREEIVA
jgi:hypothetical protein